MHEALSVVTVGSTPIPATLLFFIGQRQHAHLVANIKAVVCNKQAVGQGAVFCTSSPANHRSQNLVLNAIYILY